MLPLDRTAYFVGETVPLALTGAGELKLEAVNGDGRTTSRRGRVPSGQGLDNAVAESFFGTLKAELLGDQPGRCFESKRQTLELAAFNGLTALV